MSLEQESERRFVIEIGFLDLGPRQAILAIGSRLEGKVEARPGEDRWTVEDPRGRLWVVSPGRSEVVAGFPGSPWQLTTPPLRWKEVAELAEVLSALRAAGGVVGPELGLQGLPDLDPDGMEQVIAEIGRIVHGPSL